MYNEECLALIEETLPNNFLPGDQFALAEVNPQKILQDYGRYPVALYAQSLVGISLPVDMTSPKLLSGLREFAAYGAGPIMDFCGVRYKFTLSKYIVLGLERKFILIQTPERRIPSLP
ncbi:hypothetical protein G7046_g7518 [Stylonectria norvegica]|nr:hypothetical protein G7046_g7518 [Stylonectria norvegica]